MDEYAGGTSTNYMTNEMLLNRGLELLAMLREPVRWPALKAAARRYVETERNWKASVARYENVYARVMQQPKHA